MILLRLVELILKMLLLSHLAKNLALMFNKLLLALNVLKLLFLEFICLLLVALLSVLVLIPELGLLKRLHLKLATLLAYLLHTSCCFASLSMRSILAVLVAMLACASAWMIATRTPTQAQCPAPLKSLPKVVMDIDDAALDNTLVEDDDNIMPARKCGFCMG